MTKSQKLDNDIDIVISKYNTIIDENNDINTQMLICSAETEKLRELLSYLKGEFEELQKYQPAMDDLVD